MSWECNARPVYNGGKRCGHVNEDGATMYRIPEHCIEVCACCGCTRKASDDRARDEQAKKEQAKP